MRGQLSRTASRPSRRDLSAERDTIACR
jgi:hypothetical protein